MVTFVIVTNVGPAGMVVLFDELESMALVLSVELIIVVVDDGEDLSIVPEVVVYCDEFRDERMEVFMTVSVDDAVGAIVTCEAGDTDDLLEVAVEIMACFVESCLKGLVIIVEVNGIVDDNNVDSSVEVDSGSIVVETEKVVVFDEYFVSCDVEAGEIVTFVIVTDVGSTDAMDPFDELESMALVLSIELFIVVVDDGENLSIVPVVVLYWNGFRDE